MRHRPLAPPLPRRPELEQLKNEVSETLTRFANAQPQRSAEHELASPVTSGLHVLMRSAKGCGRPGDPPGPTRHQPPQLPREPPPALTPWQNRPRSDAAKARQVFLARQRRLPAPPLCDGFNRTWEDLPAGLPCGDGRCDCPRPLQRRQRQLQDPPLPHAAEDAIAWAADLTCPLALSSTASEELTLTRSSATTCRTCSRWKCEEKVLTFTWMACAFSSAWPAAPATTACWTPCDNSLR